MEKPRTIKLDNYVQTLEAVILDGKNLGPGTFVSITHISDPLEKADTGITLVDYLRAQKRDVQDNVFVPEARLSVKETVKELKDPTNEAYTVMMVVVQNPKAESGIECIAMAMPDVLHRRGGEPFGTFMYNPTAREGFDNAYLDNGKKTPLLDFMTDKNMALIKRYTGENALLLGYDENTPGLFKHERESLVNRGWKPLIGIGVPSLEDGADPDKEVAQLNFVYKSGHNPTRLEVHGLIRAYLDNAYDAGPSTHTGLRLVRRAMYKIDKMFK